MNANLFSNRDTVYRSVAVASIFVILVLGSVCGVARGEEPAPAPAPEAPKPTQATIEVLVLDYASDKLFDLGTSGIFKRREGGPGHTGEGNLSLVDLAFPSLDTSGLGLAMFLDKISIGEGAFEFLIQALEQDENVEILSRPRVLLEKGVNTTKDGAILPTAVIQTVEKVPYETTKVVGVTKVQVTEFKDTGVTLEVTLIDIDNDSVLLQLRAAVIAAGPRLRVAIAEQPEGSAVLVPEFFNRSVTTEVVVGDRQILVVGALLSTEKTTSRRSIPVLGELPLLKYIFASQRDRDKYRELIFFVKPIIHRGGYVPRPPGVPGQAANESSEKK